MILIDLIDWLEKQDPNAVVPHGFGKPNSFRGYYEALAFEPQENVRLGEMLEHAKSALGQTFSGYKGGKYTMEKYTECWICEYGTACGADQIGNTMLKLWEACAKSKQWDKYCTTEKVRG